jgi:hypothetical protein
MEEIRERGREVGEMEEGGKEKGRKGVQRRRGEGDGRNKGEGKGGRGNVRRR